jgi:uncharacterized OB-fold protein
MASISREKYLPVGLPAPSLAPDALDAPYWQGATEHRLMIQACTRCGAVKWPPEEVCAACHSFDRTWVEAGGTGTIVAWTRCWHPVHPALATAGPYIVVIVELSDYPVRMAGNLLGDPLQEVVIGSSVHAVFEDQPTGGYTLVQWVAV